jgi:hypothetical protein
MISISWPTAFERIVQNEVIDFIMNDNDVVDSKKAFDEGIFLLRMLFSLNKDFLLSL